MQDKGIVHNVGFDMYNGEKEKLFDRELLINKFKNRAVPEGFGLGWKDINQQGYAGDVNFDEKEITAAFKVMYKDNSELESELIFTVNPANNFVSVLLKSSDKKIRLLKTTVDVYKTRK